MLLQLISGFVALQLPAVIVSCGMANPQLHRNWLISIHETNIFPEIIRFKCNSSGNYRLYLFQVYAVLLKQV